MGSGVRNTWKIAPRNFWSDENILYQLEWQLHSHLHLSNIIELSIQHENMSLKLNYTSVKLTWKSFVRLVRFSMSFKMNPGVPEKVATALQPHCCFLRPPHARHRALPISSALQREPHPSRLPWPLSQWALHPSSFAHSACSILITFHAHPSWNSPSSSVSCAPEPEGNWVKRVICSPSNLVDAYNSR